MPDPADNDFFRLHTDGASLPPGVAHLQLHRGERLNTLEPAFFPAFRDALLRLDRAGTTRALVISSTGRHFSAGMSLEVFAAGLPLLQTGSARDRLAFHDALRDLMRCFDVVEQVRYPVLCAVQGGCIGGALDLAAACDLRLASADAFFTVQEIHIGMAADLGVLQRLPKIVPDGVARQMAYTGERVDAGRALAIGLVNAVLPDAAALLAHALAFAGQVAEKSPLAIAASKRALGFARDHSTADALDQMALLQSALFDLDEMRRAIEAWRGKSAGAFDPLPASRSL